MNCNCNLQRYRISNYVFNVVKRNSFVYLHIKIQGIIYYVIGYHQNTSSIHLIPLCLLQQYPDIYLLCKVDSSDIIEIDNKTTIYCNFTYSEQFIEQVATNYINSLNYDKLIEYIKMCDNSNSELYMYKKGLDKLVELNEATEKSNNILNFFKK